MVQAVFAFLAYANAVRWPVRKLAEVAGIGKTVAAEARQRLTETGALQATRAGLKIADRKALEEFTAQLASCGPQPRVHLDSHLDRNIGAAPVVQFLKCSRR